MKKIFNLSNFTLLVALFLSTIAAWFAIIGLVSIFPSKATEIIVMGGAIEIGKIVAAIWLRKYWNKSDWQFKVILVPMVGILMLLTSMGTFGFLSSAHSEQNLVSGNISSKVALIDEKIKVQRENITFSRNALAQLDMQVNNVMIKGDSERSAARSVQIRRQQAQERNKLQKEIDEANVIIATLNEERIPLASQLRKVEAEIGPIKYIAALIYGDNPGTDVLEKSVRWVIILLVVVFDPLAIALVLAGNASKKWDEDINTTNEGINTIDIEKTEIKAEVKKDPTFDKEDMVKSKPDLTEYHKNDNIVIETKTNDFNLKDHPYLFKTPKKYHPPGVEPVGPQVYIRDTETVFPTISEDNTENTILESISEKQKNGWSISNDIFKNFERDFLNGFGNNFPNIARKGALFVRTDYLPHKVYKFNGVKWIEVDKLTTDTYISNESYLKFLIEKIGDGSLDPEFLTDYEKESIENFLKKNS